MEIGIVILNYLNWTDTFECIESLEQQTNQNFQIVVVDNASNNESFAELSKRYKGVDQVHLLRNEENLGFAKGNNTGILYCKNILKLKNVLVINNDVIFTDPDYIDFLVHYDIEDSIGVIGTKIIGADGQNQNPNYFNPSVKAVFREYSIPLLRKYHLTGILDMGRMVKKVVKKPRPASNESRSQESSKPYVLHGSVIFLTEHYLSKMNGLYPETFLYYEEEILGLVCKKLNLKMIYTDLKEIYHKEDQSSQMSFQNLEGVKYKFARESVRTGLKVSRMSAKEITTKINSYPYEFFLEKKGKTTKYTFHS